MTNITDEIDYSSPIFDFMNDPRLRERCLPNIVREIKELLSSMNQRGAEPALLDAALKQILIERGVS